jgi:ElaB/YqjD/DUF883 family membrane-anchored ribosome-binding protein
MSANRNTQTSSAKPVEDGSAPTSKRVSSIAHEAVDKAAGKAEEVEKKVRAEAGRLAEKSSETAAEAKQQFEATLNRVDEFVNQRPFAAAGIAFAAGVVGALLIRR